MRPRVVDIDNVLYRVIGTKKHVNGDSVVSSSDQLSPVDVLLLVLVMLLWGFNFVMIRLGLNDFPPLLFATLRFVVVVPCVWFVARPEISWARLVSFGFIFGVMIFGLLIVGIAAGMPAGAASLVMQVNVLFTVLMGVVFLRERPLLLRWIAIAIGFTGVGISGYDFAVREGTALVFGGFMIVLGAAFCWGIANIMMKQMGSINMLGLMVWVSIVPPIPLLALSLMIEGPQAVIVSFGGLSWVGLVAIVYTGLISTLLAYGIWGTLLARYSTAAVSPFSLLVPVFGFGAATVFLGETIVDIQMLAAAIVSASLVLTVLAPWISRRAGRQWGRQWGRQ